MADTKITALTAITTVDPAVDVLPIVDVSDTSMAASGTTKKITSNQILGAGGTATLASATVTGNATAAAFIPSGSTVPTNGTYLPSANTVGWAVNSTNAMTLNSTGLGVGGAPISGFRLNVNNGDFRVSDVQNEDGVEIGWSAGAGSGYVQVYNRTTSAFKDLVLNNAATITSSGNVGIGVTPSAWISAVKGLQVGAYGAIGGSSSNFNVYGNLYASAGGTAYLGNGYGTLLQMTGGQYAFYQAGNNTSGAGALATLTQAMTLDASGNLYLKTTSRLSSGVFSVAYVPGTSQGAVFQPSTDVSSPTPILFLNSSGSAVGSITTTASATAYNISSDYRLKEAVQPLVGGLARISALKPSIYKWKADGSNGEGFLAHELAEVVPLAVTGEKDAVNEDGSIKAQGVDLSKVVPVLVAAIQELAAEVNALKNA